MRIGELAGSTGQTPKTIRFYEAEGLMPDPPRTPSGYRVYGDEDIERLRFIGMAKRLGLSLGEIGGILRLHDRREPTCGHVRSLLDEKLAQIERALAELQAFRSEISRLKDETGDQTDCRSSGGGICSIIEESGIDVSVATLNLNLAGPTPR
jgi:MerR family copper efflux transcriptional regulator